MSVLGRVLGIGVKVTVALGVVAGLAAGVWFGSQLALRRSSERELGQAWAAYAKCAVGEVPVGETPSVHYRAIELGAAAADWPARCVVFQANFYNASHRAARFGVINFEEDIPRADMVNKDTQMFAVPAEQLDRLFKDATTLAAASVVYDLRTVPSAPPAAELVRLSKQKPLGQGPVLATDPIAYGDVRLLFADRVCWMRASDHYATATCTPVAPDLSVEHVLAASEDGAPALVLPRGDTGFVRADGTAYVLGQGDPYSVVKKTVDGKTQRLAFGRPAGENVAFIQLVGENLVWAIGTTTDPWGDYYGGGGYAPYGGYYSVNLYARTLDSAGHLGALADLGPPSGNDFAGPITGCRTNEGTFLRMREALLSRAKGQAWGGFVAAPRGIEPIADSFVCNGAEAMILGLTDASMGMPSVQQTRCVGVSCSVTTVALDTPGATLVTRADLSAITGVGEPIVVARESDGLRVRVAKLTDLPTTPDRVLLDGEEGKPGSEHVTHVSLYGRGGPTAVLLVQAATGTFGFTVEASGKMTPIDVNAR